MQTGPETTYSRLNISHLNDVAELYRAVTRDVPAGYLSSRAENDFAELLADGRTAVCVGAISCGRLVGYSLSQRLQQYEFDNAPLMSDLYRRGDSIWFGRGTVVDPSRRGQFIMLKLLNMRAEIMKSLPFRQHSVGLIAVGNLQSLASALRAGANVVGIHDDGLCDNYVCYGGEALSRPVREDFVSVEIDDVGTLNQMLRCDFIGTKILPRSADKRRQLIMSSGLFLA